MYKQIIVHSLNHFINSRGMTVYGWCLMSNNLHLICQTQEPFSLIDLGKDFMEFTCGKMVNAIKDDTSDRKAWLLRHFRNADMPLNSANGCWGGANTYALIDIHQPQNVAEQLELIHNMPVKERIVQYAADYIYSSARDYSGISGLVKIYKPPIVEQELYELESRKSYFRSNYQ